MFEKELAEKMKAIFKVKDVTFDAPGESREQDKLFIEIEEPHFRITDKKARAMVTGKGTMFGRNEALTFGYFSQAIAKADNALTKDLIFRDFETNTLRFRDIVERGFSFTYFFATQHDPAVGNMTSVDITIEET